MTSFGKNIKFLRQTNGLSQQQFANLFELSRGSVGSYEEGRADPKIDTLVKIASYFKLSIDDLVLGNVNKLDVESPINIAEEDLKPQVYIEDRVQALERRLDKLEGKMKQE